MLLQRPLTVQDQALRQQLPLPPWCAGVYQGINLQDVSGKGIITSLFAAVSVESRVNLLPPCR